jgi:hypothetical protein
MDNPQHGHDAHEAHDNLNITRKLKSGSCNFNHPRSSFILTTEDLYFTSTLLVRDNIDIHLVSTSCNNLFPFVLAIVQIYIAPNASWVKRKNMCMWLAKNLQAYALRVAWKMFA